MSAELALVVLLVVQQAFYMWQIHKLMNKLMSRNYFDYEASKPKMPAKRKEVMQVPEDTEEMGILQPFLVP